MIGFFSSDEYFEQIYKALSKVALKVDFLVTEPPKPSGRGLKETSNKAHVFAKQIGLKVLTPKNLREGFQNELGDLTNENKTSLGLVYSYGKIIPENIIDTFPKGIINIHFSLLPQYRGATPMQRALLENKTETGLTFFLIDKGLDTGLVLKQESVEISETDNFTSLKKKSLELTVSILPKVVLDYLGGKLLPKKQEIKGISYTSKFIKEDGKIDMKGNAIQAMNKIRAFCEFPRSFIQIDDIRLIINKAHLEDGTLAIDEIQLPGRKAISFEEFKNGYPHLLTKLPLFVKI